MTKKEIEERREMARKQREELRKKLAANPGKGRCKNMRLVVSRSQKG